MVAEPVGGKLNSIAARVAPAAAHVCHRGRFGRDRPRQAQPGCGRATRHAWGASNRWAWRTAATAGTSSLMARVVTVGGHMPTARR